MPLRASGRLRRGQHQRRRSWWNPMAGAQVKGDITTPALRVIEGAKLEGRVQMRVENLAAKATRPGRSCPGSLIRGDKQVVDRVSGGAERADGGGRSFFQQDHGPGSCRPKVFDGPLYTLA